MLKNREFKFIIFILLILSFQAMAQKKPTNTSKPEIIRVDPPEWWTGFKDRSLELLIYGHELKELTEARVKPDDISITGVKPAPNPSFLFLEIEIDSAAKEGKYEITLSGKGKKVNFTYELHKRLADSLKAPDASDVIYLIMPDRFANGNVQNDEIKYCKENQVHRDSIKGRHGGDLEGIKNKLPYLKDMGISALWLNPVQENNQPFESYHGYAITDHYHIDPRLGKDEDYFNLVKEAHTKGLKIIMDVVLNHYGNEHWLYKEMPSADWVHQFSNFTRTNYRAVSLMDPYASNSDKNIFSNGWFDKHMPDLNQSNEFVCRYLIQNTIWWIEKARIDGLRVDTWAYSEPGFTKKWANRIKLEYPQIGLFGEIWEHGTGVQSYFGDKEYGDLPGVTDFQLYYAINEALTQPSGWTQGASKIYYTLAQDYLYKNPNSNVLFLDNHDLSRFYSAISENKDKFTAGLAFLFTMRGIPSLFYGTEILMKNYANPDARVRNDFPGGWKSDTENKFEESGRNAEEQAAYKTVASLAQLKRSKKALQKGSLTQFVPENGLYVYFRTLPNEKFMMVFNFNENAQSMELNRFSEKIKNSKSGFDHIAGQKTDLTAPLKLRPWQCMIIEIEHN